MGRGIVRYRWEGAVELDLRCIGSVCYIKRVTVGREARARKKEVEFGAGEKKFS